MLADFWKSEWWALRRVRVEANQFVVLSREDGALVKHLFVDDDSLAIATQGDRYDIAGECDAKWMSVS